MSGSNNSSLPPSEEQPFRLWEQSMLWQNELHEEATRKALDIPTRKTGLTVNRTRNVTHNRGLGLGSLLAVAAGAGVVGTGAGMVGALALPLLLKMFDREPAPPSAPPPAQELPAGTDTFHRIKPLPGE